MAGGGTRERGGWNATHGTGLSCSNDCHGAGRFGNCCPKCSRPACRRARGTPPPLIYAARCAKCSDDGQVINAGGQNQFIDPAGNDNPHLTDQRTMDETNELKKTVVTPDALRAGAVSTQILDYRPSGQ